MYFRYDSDKSRCSETTSRSTKAAVVLVTSIVVPVLVVAALFLAYFIWRAKRKPHGVHPVALIYYHAWKLLVYVYMFVIFHTCVASFYS